MGHIDNMYRIRDATKYRRNRKTPRMEVRVTRQDRIKQGWFSGKKSSGRPSDAQDYTGAALTNEFCQLRQACFDLARKRLSVCATFINRTAATDIGATIILPKDAMVIKKLIQGLSGPANKTLARNIFFDAGCLPNRQKAPGPARSRHDDLRTLDAQQAVLAFKRRIHGRTSTFEDSSRMFGIDRPLQRIPLRYTGSATTSSQPLSHGHYCRNTKGAQKLSSGHLFAATFFAFASRCAFFRANSSACSAAKRSTYPSGGTQIEEDQRASLSCMSGKPD